MPNSKLADTFLGFSEAMSFLEIESGNLIIVHDGAGSIVLILTTLVFDDLLLRALIGLLAGDREGTVAGRLESVNPLLLKMVVDRAPDTALRRLSRETMGIIGDRLLSKETMGIIGDSLFS